MDTPKKTRKENEKELQASKTEKWKHNGLCKTTGFLKSRKSALLARTIEPSGWIKM